MLPLPILNVHLNACAEDWQQMTPTAQGRYCAHCNRVVIDFTKSTQAELDAAYQAAGGRVCGRFRQNQLTPKLPLRPKLRRFLVALVLVCGLGLTSGEAWAQVRKTAPVGFSHKQSNGPAKKLSKTASELKQVEFETLGELVAQPVVSPPGASQVYGYVEQMPVYKSGGSEGLMKFVQSNVRWPAGSGMLDAEGKVFISFVVDKNGQVGNAKVLKGIHPILDAEALRVVRLLDGQFEPGKQNNRPVDVSYTIPVTFKRD
ncbi:energy transducer TonB [uncultured Hymenobacter sp.]|uniref:energy transducer TonB n=1 Tax=uncultured Hymenobacter sp. TaxID=170016 RepID=UPI0035CB0661